MRTNEGLKPAVGLLRRSVVQVDGVEGEFDCWVEHGADWNGFACPWFDLRGVTAVIGAIGKMAQPFVDMASVEVGIAAVTLRSMQDHPDDRQEFEAVLFPVEGRLYPLGNRHWCWSEVGGAVSGRWPLEIGGIEDLRQLVTALVAERRDYHFDDDPSTVMRATWGHADNVFNANEAALLRKLMADCVPFGGVWEMMEAEEGQHCHKLLGIDPEKEEAKREAVPSTSKTDKLVMEFSTVRARRQGYGRDERAEGPHPDSETYYCEGSEDMLIGCGTSEREDFERETGESLDSDTLPVKTWAKLADWLNDNAGLRVERVKSVIKGVLAGN